MKKVVSCLLCISILLLIFSAGTMAADPANDNFRASVNYYKVEKENYTITLFTPYFEGFKSADSVNAFVQDREIDDVAQINFLYEEGKNFYEEEKGKGQEAHFPPASLYTDFTYSKSGDILSLKLDKSNYTGGAHGSSWINSITTNTKTGEIYSSFSSLFQASGNWQKYIVDGIEKQIKAESDMYFEDALKTVRDQKGNFHFYIDGNNVVIYFGQYELAPYAAGIRLFKFSAAELKGYLKPEIYNSIKNAKQSGGITVNGIAVNLSQPIIEGIYDENYVTLVPVRGVANALGLNVTYNAAKKEATVGTAVLKVGVNSYAANSSDKSIKLETAPKLVNNTMFVPFSFFSEVLKYNSMGTNIYTNVNTANNFDNMISNFAYPSSEQECIKMFEQAQKDKNGAIQYALCNNALRSKVRGALVAADWAANIDGTVASTEKVDEIWLIKSLKPQHIR